MSWSQKNGYEFRLRAISDPDEKAINVSDVRGQQRLTTVGAKRTVLLRLVKEAEEADPSRCRSRIRAPSAPAIQNRKTRSSYCSGTSLTIDLGHWTVDYVSSSGEAGSAVKPLATAPPIRLFPV
ncbi:hypothetical protein A4X13_0g6957 [Tilletia indica]|uniref:Uncharacterized protein n=1 Tax=Tilletia indica TaxID=43049 RepID=A0A177TD32_9BASI|nr:hypothetical protein A4X13_0g6957 [Tilletia indica]